MRGLLPNALRRGVLALLGAAALACDDTDVTVAINTSPPPDRTNPPPGGVVVIASASAQASSPSPSSPRVHADRIYGPSPRGPARIAADDHAVASNPGTGGKNYDNDTNIYFGNDGAPRHAFLRARLRDIPPRARILDATLQILSRFADAEPGCHVYVGLVPKDGRWDVTRQKRWALAPSFDGIVTARDASGAALATTGLTGNSGTANFGLDDTGEPVSFVSSTKVGQTLTVTTGGALADVQVLLRRAGTLSGATRIRVERCRADDGSDDRPDGVPLGRSAPVPIDAIASASEGSLMTYAFASGPTLVPGGRYAFILESDTRGSATNHVQWKIQHDDLYSAGGLVNFGRAVAWNVVAYPEASQLPFFFDEDLVTPRIAPFGTLTSIEDVPAFPAPDTWVDVADVATLLQEWVDGPRYVAGDVVAVELFTAASTPPGARRRGKDFRLLVTWREPAPPGPH